MTYQFYLPFLQHFRSASKVHDKDIIPVLETGLENLGLSPKEQDSMQTSELLCPTGQDV